MRHICVNDDLRMRKWWGTVPPYRSILFGNSISAVDWHILIRLHHGRNVRGGDDTCHGLHTVHGVVIAVISEVLHFARLSVSTHLIVRA